MMDLSLCLDAQLPSLQNLSAEIEKFARSAKWPANVEYQIQLVLEEIVINIVNYSSCGNGQVQVNVNLVSAEDAITVEITDNGQAFDPLTDAPPPDTESALEDRPTGGLGIHLVQTLMDHVSYKRAGDMNQLTLVRRRTDK